jgi:hypothetical protein
MTRARLFQLALLWLIVSAMVWLTTIWRWQSQDADVGTSDILLQLIVLPLLLAAVLGGAIWAVGHTRRQASAPLAAPAAPGAAGAAGATGATGASATGLAEAQDTGVGQASAVLLAEAVALSAGDEPAQARETLAASGVRPGLDPELQDVDGMPVFSARHPALDVDSWLEASSPDAALAQPWQPEVARSLALLQPVLHTALDALSAQAGPDAAGWQAWLQRGQAARDTGPASGPAPLNEADQPSYLSGVARPETPAAQLARKAQAPILHVRLLLPAWPAAQREQAVAWVKAQCGALLDWAEAMSARGVNWLVEPVTQNEDLWSEVDQMLVRWQREGRPELLLLLAADSAITPQAIERMQARGELFTGQHQIGRMPGEAAVALLLGTPHWLGHASAETPDPAAAGAAYTARAVRLHRPVRTRRDKSADAQGRLGVQAVAAALQQVVDQHRPDAEGLHIVSDADHRASRTGELYESVAAIWPAVDPMLAVTRVGQGCGDLGVAGVLVPCALASAWLRAAGSEQATAAPMALALHLQSSHERVVVPLAPWRRVVSAPEPAARAAS